MCDGIHEQRYLEESNYEVHTLAIQIIQIRTDAEERGAGKLDKTLMTINNVSEKS